MFEAKLSHFGERFDFIGAPDSPNHFNGGLSLRNIDAMLRVLALFKAPRGQGVILMFMSVLLSSSVCFVIVRTMLGGV